MLHSPVQPVLLQCTGKPVGQLAQGGVPQNAHQHDVGLQELSSVHGQVTNAGPGRDVVHHLGGGVQQRFEQTHRAGQQAQPQAAAATSNGAGALMDFPPKAKQT